MLFRAFLTLSRLIVFIYQLDFSFSLPFIPLTYPIDVFRFPSFFFFTFPRPSVMSSEGSGALPSPPASSYPPPPPNPPPPLQNHPPQNHPPQNHPPQNHAPPGFAASGTVIGNWRSDNDVSARRGMIAKIVALLGQKKPNAPPEWTKKLPQMAKVNTIL